jgi:HSP20 family protein
MDKETKSFFEKLAGINKEEEEFKPELKFFEDDSKEIEEDGEEEKSASSIFEEAAEGELAVDVYQTANNFVVEATIAGVDPENIDVSITPDSITIRGKREKMERVKADEYLLQECFWGRFSRTIILPQEFDSDKASASIKNGVLKITLPKISKTKTKRIKVKFE